MLVEKISYSGYKAKASFKPKVNYKPKVAHKHKHFLALTAKTLHRIGESVAQYRRQHLFLPFRKLIHNIGQTVEHNIVKKVDPIEYIKNQPWITSISIFDFSKRERVRVRINGNLAHISMWIPKELALKYLADYIHLRKPRVIFVDGLGRHEQIERTGEGYIVKAQPMYYPVI
jgi:hypothetical protein